MRPRPPLALSIVCPRVADLLGRVPSYRPFAMHYPCARAMGFDLLAEQSSRCPTTGAHGFPMDESKKYGRRCDWCDQPLWRECPWRVQMHVAAWTGVLTDAA